MFKRNSKIVRVIAFVCVISLALASCAAPPAATVEAPASDTPAPPVLLPEPSREKSALCEPLQFRADMNGVTLPREPIDIAPDPDQPEFAKGLVIIVGIPDAVRQVVDQANADDPTLQLTPLANITLQPKESQADLDPNDTIRKAFSPQASGPSVEISLHRTSKPISDTVRIVNTTAGKMKLIVIGQPDYMTGRIGGDPWTIGGNPWTIGGNPWTIGGNPAGSAAGSTESFWTQWGVKNAISKEWILTDSLTANDIRIAVFDTSPFDQPGQYRFKDWFLGLDRLGWAEDAPTDVPLVICASDPLADHFRQTDSPLPDFSDHGAFVAGLTHAGAPGAHVDLVRSMFNNAEGDAFSLLANLNAYGLTHQNALSQTVINLSLGMRPPTLAGGMVYDYRAMGLDDATLQLIANVLAQLFFKTSVWPQEYRDTLLKTLPPDVAMAVMVTALTQPQSNKTPYNGATVVAAAGNDAFANQVKEAQLPARYPNVIGVEGSNFSGGLSCFSNTVQPKQPFDRQAGGDCLTEEISTALPATTATWQSKCPDNQDCLYTVTSISVRSRQWMRWRGTSFATAIVSGMEARKLP